MALVHGVPGANNKRICFLTATCMILFDENCCDIMLTKILHLSEYFKSCQLHGLEQVLGVPYGVLEFLVLL